MLLDKDLLDDLKNQAVVDGLVERRSNLLAGLPAGFALSLPKVSRPLDQMNIDLTELNRTPRLMGLDRPPLAIWLENAFTLTKKGLYADLYRQITGQRLTAVIHDAAKQELRELRLVEMGDGSWQMESAGARVPVTEHRLRDLVQILGYNLVPARSTDEKWKQLFTED